MSFLKIQWLARISSLKVKVTKKCRITEIDIGEKKIAIASSSRNTTTYSRAAERIDPVNPAAAMNAHVSAVLYARKGWWCMQYGGDGWRGPG